MTNLNKWPTQISTQDLKVLKDYSDDEEEKNAKSKLKEKRKVDPAIEAERAEKRRLKEEKIQESTVYICGLPPDFRERDIKGNG